MKINKITLYLLLLLCTNIFSQKDSSGFKYWLNIGTGINNSSKLAVGANFNFSTWNFYSQVGYQFISRVIGAPNAGDVREELPLNVINLGIGKIITKQYYFASFMVGPAVVFGEKKGYKYKIVEKYYMMFETKRFIAMGFVYNAQLFYTFSKPCGIGLELFGVINAERSMAEIKASISLNVGSLF
ncbi:MAG: hypothetical protein V1773_10690 [bacterium]